MLLEHSLSKGAKNQQLPRYETWEDRDTRLRPNAHCVHCVLGGTERNISTHAWTGHANVWYGKCVCERYRLTHNCVYLMLWVFYWKQSAGAHGTQRIAHGLLSEACGVLILHICITSQLRSVKLTAREKKRARDGSYERGGPENVPVQSHPPKPAENKQKSRSPAYLVLWMLGKCIFSRFTSDVFGQLASTATVPTDKNDKSHISLISQLIQWDEMEKLKLKKRLWFVKCAIKSIALKISIVSRSFFLKANLPLLQRELLHCARMAKQTPAQYLAQHEQLLLDANASSPLDSSEIMLELNEHGKRRTPDRYTAFRVFILYTHWVVNIDKVKQRAKMQTATVNVNTTLPWAVLSSVWLWNAHTLTCNEWGG